jgi:tetratricopeptide (TPR) repeat protein
MNSPQVGYRVIALAFLLLGLIAAGSLLAAARIARRPASFSDLPPLLAAGRFDEVEAKLRAFLEFQPDHTQANMLMAQAALARPDQKPRLALEHLRRVRAWNPEALAIVRLNEGKAHSALGSNNLAEDDWLEALRLDPLVPEAGWNLLGLYQVQGRREDAHRLAMKLFDGEPDPHDRAQLLLELLRQDAQPISADSLIRTLEPMVKEHPDDTHAAIALGRAYLRNSRPGEGLPIIRGAVERSAYNPYTWDALLTSLDESSSSEELAQCLQRLPPSIAGDPRFTRHRGALALGNHDWAQAAIWYLRAYTHDQSDGQVLYRLCQALRAARRTGDTSAFDARFRALRAAREQALPLYKEANSVETLGTAPHPDLYHRLADLREHMGRADEAVAWHQLVLKDQPDDPISRSAVERLATQEIDTRSRQEEIRLRRQDMRSRAVP